MSSITLRRRRTLRVAAAALTVAAGLTLTACNGSDTAGAKTSGKADSAAAAADREATGSSNEVQGSGSQADSGSGAKSETVGKQSGKQAAGGAQSGVQRCHTSGLKAAFATGGDATPDPNAGGSTTTSIVLTNTSGSTCKIGGFPGVDLNTEHGSADWSLQRSSAKYSSITLNPGDSTDFTINLALAGENDENSWTPAFAVITPPNETSSLTLDWPWGGLVDQRGATHPATFVNPIG
ncbi:DUF4232 domain-containing protein [Streptomyces sp. NEAU-YJ-81]|uniref:DUF4232 domain-containing protein n=1 Tax=Streptomyces sp. NEAU-YJ-81 TaxID=2820288 RepID=UPI001ABD1A9B|nr:DUF4232 domain-containing protein [Streptomyces sp. NEAU-YJ-81]MBO3675314.1 DUF4232 domain-containing protein [Streptomyces sp. NEAU-YJ-81]